MLISDVYPKVQAALDTAGITFFDSARIQVATHDAVFQTTLLGGTIEDTIQVAIQADKPYYDFTSISNFYSVVAIYNLTAKHWLVPRTLRQLDAMDEKWEIRNGNPQYFCPVNWKYTAITPTPVIASGFFQLYYKGREDFIQGFSTTISIPRASLPMIVDRATAELLEMYEEYGKAQVFWQSYFEALFSTTKATQNRASSDLVRAFTDFRFSK